MSSTKVKEGYELVGYVMYNKERSLYCRKPGQGTQALRFILTAEECERIASGGMAPDYKRRRIVRHKAAQQYILERTERGPTYVGKYCGPPYKGTSNIPVPMSEGDADTILSGETGCNPAHWRKLPWPLPPAAPPAPKFEGWVVEYKSVPGAYLTTPGGYCHKYATPHVFKTKAEADGNLRGPGFFTTQRHVIAWPLGSVPGPVAPPAPPAPPARLTEGWIAQIRSYNGEFQCFIPNGGGASRPMTYPGGPDVFATEAEAQKAVDANKRRYSYGGSTDVYRTVRWPLPLEKGFVAQVKCHWDGDNGYRPIPKDGGTCGELHVFATEHEAWKAAHANGRRFNTDGSTYVYRVIAWPEVKAPPAPKCEGWVVRHAGLKDLKTPYYITRPGGVWGPKPYVFKTRLEADREAEHSRLREVLAWPLGSTPLADAPAGKSYVVRKTDAKRFKTKAEAQAMVQQYGLKDCEIRLEDDSPGRAA